MNSYSLGSLLITKSNLVLEGRVLLKLAMSPPPVICAIDLI